MRASPSLVIFDLDGVLVDSEVLSASALIEELGLLGHAITRADVRRDFLGRSFPVVAAGLRQRIGPAFPDDFEARYRARLFASFERSLKVTPGLDAVLDALDVQACVATSSTRRRTEKALRACGLWQRFEGRINTAAEVPRGKPAPDLFLLAARRGGVQPRECLVIEDSAPGLDAAAAAGMRSVLYLGGAHHAGAEWEGPAPSDGCIRDWSDLAAQVPGIVR